MTRVIHDRPAAGPAVERVLQRVRRSIFEGRLPPGTPLREVPLSDELGVARSTVREALGLLVSEGLAVHEPNRGTQVRATDASAIRDVSRARAVLELAGVRHWDEADEDDREAVRDAMRRLGSLAEGEPSVAQINAAHLAVHTSLAGLTGSRRLTTVAEGLTNEIRLALARVDLVRRDVAEQLHDHQLLLDLLEQGRSLEAIEELDRHLHDAEESMIELLG